MTPATRRQLSPQEFLEFERKSSERHQFWGGEVFAMTGGTHAHAMLALAVGAELRAQLQRQGGGVFGADLRVHSAYRQSYLYPDVSAVCGPQFHEQQPADTLVNPTLIVEVLSDSTESFDRGEKFRASQAITSLQHYALVSQHEPRIEVFTRATGGSWTLHSHGPGERIDFHAPECTLGIDEVYLGVPLTPAPPRG